MQPPPSADVARPDLFTFLFSLKASENRESSVWLQSQAERWAELLPWRPHPQCLQGAWGLVRLRGAGPLELSLFGGETQVLVELWPLYLLFWAGFDLLYFLWEGDWCMLYSEKWINKITIIMSFIISSHHIMYYFNYNSSCHFLRSYCVPSTMLTAFIH